MITKTIRSLAIIGALAFFAGKPANAQLPPTNGLQLWLKADAITGLADGQKIATWSDISSNGFHATQATVANQPVFHTNVLNSLPAVRFSDDGSTSAGNTNINHLTSSLTLNGNSNAVTAIIVFRSNFIGVRDTLIQPLGSGSTWLYTQLNNTPGSTPATNLINSASGRTLTAHAGYQAGTWTIVSAVQNPANATLDMFRDGVSEGSTDIGTTSAASSGGWLFGANKTMTGNGLSGDIAEILIYGSALSITDRRAAEEYLAMKYNLPVKENILTDTFNTADTTDVSADLATRQTGMRAPITNTPPFYTVKNSVTDTIEIRTNTLKISILDVLASPSSPPTKVSPNLNFLGSEGNFSFRFSCDVNPTANNVNEDSWAGIKVRGGSTLQSVLDVDGLGLLIRPLGAVNVFEGPNLIALATVTSNTGHRVVIEVVSDVASLTIDGTPVAFTNGQYTWLLSNANSANFVTLCSHATAAAMPAASVFDNFVFSVIPVSPPPTSVILTDNFNTANTTNLDSNLTSRQTGTAAPQGYFFNLTSGVSAAIEGNQLSITNVDGVNSTGTIFPGVNFQPYESSSSFRIRCKVTPVVTAGDSWAGIKIREPNPNVGAVGGQGLGIIVRPGGAWHAFQGETNIANGAVLPAGTYAYDIRVVTNVTKVYINDQLLNLGGNYTMPATNSPASYVSLSSFGGGAVVGARATFDDFEYTVPVSVPPTPVQPVLINPNRAGGNFSFQFNSESGFVYTTEYKDALSQPSWNFLSATNGTGGLVTVTDSSAAGLQRFYRVRTP